MPQQPWLSAAGPPAARPLLRAQEPMQVCAQVYSQTKKEPPPCREAVMSADQPLLEQTQTDPNMPAGNAGKIHPGRPVLTAIVGLWVLLLHKGKA